jgi:hypothetical protein
LQPSDGRVVIENCIVTGNAALSFGLSPPDDTKLPLPRCSVTLSGNTCINKSVLVVQFDRRKFDFPAERDGGALIPIKATNNAFDAGLIFSTHGDEQALPSQGEVETYHQRVLNWQGQGNAYSGQEFGRFELAYGQPGTKLGKSLWAHWWTPEEKNSFSGNFLYKGSLAAHPGQVRADDFRLAPGSAGYRASRDGKDLGADIDFVGPGEAFDKWRQTAEYRSWRTQAAAMSASVGSDR